MIVTFIVTNPMRSRGLWLRPHKERLALQVVLSTDVNQNVCLEMCTDENFARGSCSLTENNLGTDS